MQHIALSRSKAKSDRAENDCELCAKSILNETRDDRLPRVIELGSAVFLDYVLLHRVFPLTANAAYQVVPQDEGPLLLTTNGSNT